MAHIAKKGSLSKTLQDLAEGKDKGADVLGASASFGVVGLSDDTGELDLVADGSTVQVLYVDRDDVSTLLTAAESAHSAVDHQVVKANAGRNYKLRITLTGGWTDVEKAKAHWEGVLGADLKSSAEPKERGYDPEMTNPDKMVYVKDGQEPMGVLRAVLEVWGDKSQRDALKQAVQDRVADASYNWEEAVISALFEYLLQGDHWDNAALISRFAEKLAHPLSRAWDDDDPNGIKIINGSGSQAEILEIFSLLHKHDPDNLTDYHTALTIYEMWALLDGAKWPVYRDVLGKRTVRDAKKQVHTAIWDFDTLLTVPPPNPPDDGELVVALTDFFLNEKKAEPETLEFLKALVDPSKGEFLPGVKVKEKLDGLMGLETALELLGFGSAAPGPDKEANLDLDQDQVNESYVKPMTARGKARRDARVYKVPTSKRKHKMGSLQAKDAVYIVGSTGRFYAIEFLNSTGFVSQRNIKVKK